MPRPLKEGFGYFPLDTDFFENDDIKELRREFGAIGILTYIYLLCRIYQKGYYFAFKSEKSLCGDIAESISKGQLGRAVSDVSGVINYLLVVGKLDKPSYERGIITGRRMQEQYIISSFKAKRKIKMDLHVIVEVSEVLSKIRVSSEETPVISEETPVSPEISTQREKEREKEIHTTTTERADAHTHTRGKNENVILSDMEYDLLISKGIPAEYIDTYFSDRLATGKYHYEHHYDAILKWWNKDRARPPWNSGTVRNEKKQDKKESGSFDTDDFFQTALNRTFKKG